MSRGFSLHIGLLNFSYKKEILIIKPFTLIHLFVKHKEFCTHYWSQWVKEVEKGDSRRMENPFNLETSDLTYMVVKIESEAFRQNTFRNPDKLDFLIESPFCFTPSTKRFY